MYENAYLVYAQTLCAGSGADCKTAAVAAIDMYIGWSAGVIT
jgi:hypothetical protein